METPAVGVNKIFDSDGNKMKFNWTWTEDIENVEFQMDNDISYKLATRDIRITNEAHQVALYSDLIEFVFGTLEEQINQEYTCWKYHFSALILYFFVHLPRGQHFVWTSYVPKLASLLITLPLLKMT